jgi:large subunit ribosomal protein L21
MYAIIADGGRQYKVEEGQELEIAYRDLREGETVTFDRVLAVGAASDLKLGAPTVSGASVTGEVLGMSQGEKVDIHKLRRRKNFRKRSGHRAMFTRVKISKIAS